MIQDPLTAGYTAFLGPWFVGGSWLVGSSWFAGGSRRPARAGVHCGNQAFMQTPGMQTPGMQTPGMQA